MKSFLFRRRGPEVQAGPTQFEGHPLWWRRPLGLRSTAGSGGALCGSTQAFAPLRPAVVKIKKSDGNGLYLLELRGSHGRS